MHVCLSEPEGKRVNPHAGAPDGPRWRNMNVVTPPARSSPRSIWRVRTQREADVYGFSLYSNKAVSGASAAIQARARIQSHRW